MKKNSFFSNIALLTSGSLLAQIIVIFCAPILTRLYTADVLGMYSYIIAIVSIFTSVLNGRYDMAIVSEDNESNIWAIIKLAFIVGISTSIIATIGFGIYFCVVRVEYISYRYMIFFFFLLLIANALINICVSYNNKTREYKLMTSVYVIRTGCQNIGAILMGPIRLGVFGLMLPYTIGQYCGIYKQAKALMPHISKILKVDYSSIKNVARKYVRLPLFSVPAMFANSFSYSSVTIFMEYLFGMVAIGYYSLSTRILGLPLSLVSGNVSKVFFQEASDEYLKTGKYDKAYKKTFFFLFVLAFPMGVIMYFFSPWACGVFFGESWVVAGEYIRILTPYYMCRFVGTALSPGFLICQKQKQELLIQVLLVLASVLSFVITIMTTKSIETFLWSIGITKSIVYLTLLVVVWKNAIGATHNYN